MHLHEYSALDAVALRALITSGDVQSAEVHAAARAAIASVNGELNALAAPLFDHALECDPAGSFRGIPFLLKDTGPLARHVGFTLGSRAIKGAVALADHPLVSRCRSSGLSAIGLTATPELSLNFATESVLRGFTRNPWSLDRGVGGSSGGAAALVAAGAIPMAHASDGAGSIRVPASACGLVGLKPGRGVTPSVPRAITAGRDVAVEFALTRTVRDAAAMLDALSIDPPQVPHADVMLTDPGRLRVAFALGACDESTDVTEVAVDPQVAAATEAVARTLEWIGHAVDYAQPAVRTERVIDAEMLAIYAAGVALLHAPRPPDASLLEAVSQLVLAESRSVTATQLASSTVSQVETTAVVDEFFERYDLLVTPTLATLPLRHGTLDYDSADYASGGVRSWLRRMFMFGPFTAAYNVTGHPAISLPLGESDGGLPIGVQLVAGTGRENLLLQVAAQLEQVMPWSERQPSIFAD